MCIYLISDFSSHTSSITIIDNDVSNAPRYDQTIRYAPLVALAASFPHDTLQHSRKPMRYDMVPAYDIPCAFPLVSSRHQSLIVSSNRTSRYRQEAENTWSSRDIQVNSVASSHSDVSREKCGEAKGKTFPEPQLNNRKLDIPTNTMSYSNIDVLVSKLSLDSQDRDVEKRRILALRGTQARSLLNELQSVSSESLSNSMSDHL
jgi:hypothetical protein